ncbi:hypothetical protein [Methanosphaera stadtmanae]|jgi:hypothetical protein|uniref:hypothetical protein n=1 Tax=Methanosphaera stadtmanae TaxID=2317 RepID=UPI0011BD1AEC|nr:hypothetical protein [Methanosphaera stadtmanae]MEE0489812.1 hypothetical protein [Methanosphaera stadtmanae]
MVLREDTIGQTFLLPVDIRKLIPDNPVCFFSDKEWIVLILVILIFNTKILYVKKLILQQCFFV